jgi:SAM-dependent methyltransferase
MGAASIIADPGAATMSTARLYDDLAWLWPMWGAAEDYAGYGEHVAALIRQHARMPARSLLNVGCGGGKNAFNLKRHYAVTGLDLSPNMLALARALNPDCEFLEGDMRGFDLERTFDAVLLDDAVSYMTSHAELRSAFAAAWRHLRPGGVMIVTPDDTTETFIQNRTTATPGAGAAGPPSKDVVFIENVYDPDPADDHYEATLIYLIREDGRLRVETDHHVCGLFPLDTWRESLTGIGFEIHQHEHIDEDATYVTFACLKP